MTRKTEQFLASTATVSLLAAGLVAAAPAHADTTISGTTTTAQVTSAVGSVTVASTGTLRVGSGAAVTVDSNNTATVNSGGTITAGTATAAVNGSTGILVQPGTSTTILNSGTISVLENFTPSSINSSNTVSSAVSGVSNRYGIHVAAGGTVTGNITSDSTSTITVDGENSAGILVESKLSGALVNAGTISVLGDGSVGIKTAAVTGNVTVGGTVTVVGSGAQGVVIGGDVGGVFKIDGSIANAASYTSTSNGTLTLSQSLLDAGKAIVEVDGNVTGGILINAPASSTSTDTSRGTIASVGANTAFQIGGANNITIGGGTTNNGTYSLGIDGSVTASTVSQLGDAALAVSVGGLGGNVTLTNGLEVYGTISARSTNANATALLINAGSVVGGGALFNSGSISAASSTNQNAANVYAIRDLSGTVTKLTNQGTISASGNTTGTVTAIDLTANTSGTTITQNYTSTNQTNETNDKAASGYNPDTATAYASITGDIRTGSGNDTVDIQAGNVTGNAYLGTGNNTVKLADTAKWVGNIDFGTSGTASLSLADNARFTGTLYLHDQAGTLTLAGSSRWLGTVDSAENLAVVVNGGTFGANAATTNTIGSLTVNSGGSLLAYANGTTSSSVIAKTATFASGAKIALRIDSIDTAGKFTVLTANTLTGASTLTTSSLNLPALFTGSITTDTNNVYVTVAHASAAQLGLTAGQAGAYSAILADAKDNALIGNTLLQIYDTPTLRGRFNELLPDYAGGTFDLVTRASRLVGRHIDDESSIFSISDTAAWLEPIVFRGTRRYGDTPGFTTNGGGLSLGFEKVTAIGNLGFTLSWLTGTIKTGTYQQVKGSDYEISGFWRKSSGPLYLWARGSLGRSSFNSSRTFFGTYTSTSTSAVTTTNFTYNATGHWAGWSGGATAGVSYNLPLSEHFSVRPRGVLEYATLHENRHVEGGDNAIALTVAGRKSSQTTATTTLLAAWSAGPATHEGRPFSIEVEAGRRSHLSGDIGTTTASYETGDTFSINGGHLPSAWVGQLSILQGGLDYTWKIGTDWERSQDRGVSYGIRASISIAM